MKNEHFSHAAFTRDMPVSALIEYYRQIDKLPEEEAQKQLELFAKEIEEKYPYLPGLDPDMPGTPLAEVTFTHPANVNISFAARRFNVKRDHYRMFLLEAKLNIGDIKKRIDSKYRRCLAERMTIGYCHDNEFDEQELLQRNQLYQYWIPLKKYLDEGKQLRIWYSEYPEEICGFYHLCTLLKKYNQAFFVVKLPETAMIDGKRKQVFSWNQLPDEAIQEAADHTKQLSKEEISQYAKTWDELRKENAPLRAVINGQLISVPEEFYDQWIFDSMPKNEVMTEENVFIRYYKKIHSPGSGWLVHRIDKLIRQN